MVRDPLLLPRALLIMTSSEVTEVREGDYTTGNFRKVLGLKIQAYFTSDPQLLSDFITNLRTRPDDIFIAKKNLWRQQPFTFGSITLSVKSLSLPLFGLITQRVLSYEKIGKMIMRAVTDSDVSMQF